MLDLDGAAAFARAHGWTAFAAALAQPVNRARLGEPAAPDETLALDLADTAPKALGQMIRRGLDPRLLEVFLPTMKDRPIELGLIAWDILGGSIVDDATTLEALRLAASHVRAMLPPPGERGVRCSPPSGELAAAPAYTDADQLMDALDRVELRALAQVKRMGQTEHLGNVLETAFKYAQTLDLAHLPTLATFYLRYLWTEFDYKPAYRALCEVYFDADAPDRLAADPHPPEKSDPEFLEYANHRAAVVRRDGLEAYAQIKMINRLRTEMGMPAPAFPGLGLVEAELATRLGEPSTDIETLDAACNRFPLWRYANRVRAAWVAAFAPPSSSEPLAAADRYLAMFGNDFWFWYRMMEGAARGGQWAAGLFQRLTREVCCLPHDASTWLSLAPLVAADANRKVDDLVSEVRGRLRAQCTLAAGATS